MSAIVQRVFAPLVVAALAASPLAPRGGHFCTHARVVMAHPCCPPASEPAAPRLLCCTPVGGSTSEASELRGDGTRLALAALPLPEVPQLSWVVPPHAVSQAGVPHLVVRGQRLPLRI